MTTGRSPRARLPWDRGLDLGLLELSSRGSGMVSTNGQLGPQFGWNRVGQFETTVGNGFYYCSFDCAGDVAVKMLNVTAPTPQQLQAFKNEVGVLR